MSPITPCFEAWYGNRSAAPRRPAIEAVVDDRAAAALDRVLPERGTQPEEDAAEVDREHAVELLRRHLGKRRDRAGEARVEVVQVDPAEPLDGSGQVPVDVLLDGDVGLDRERLAGKRRRDLRRLPSAFASTTTTCAPSRARRCAVAAPIPLPPPVTTATLPASPSSAIAVSVGLSRRHSHGRQRSSSSMRIGTPIVHVWMPITLAISNTSIDLLGRRSEARAFLTCCRSPGT